MNFSQKLKLLKPFMNVADLESVICQIGIFNDGWLNYGALYKPYLLDLKKGGFYQTPLEMANFLTYIEKQEINTFFNIGTFNGWTVTFMVAYLQQTRPLHCVSINIRDQVDQALPKLGIEFIQATSDQFRCKPYDLCFIDGNHNKEWVTKDYLNVGQYAKYCAFHDINAAHCPAISPFYKELTIKHEHKEFVYHPENLPIMGIGLIHHKNPVQKPNSSNSVSSFL